MRHIWTATAVAVLFCSHATAEDMPQLKLRNPVTVAPMPQLGLANPEFTPAPMPKLGLSEHAKSNTIWGKPDPAWAEIMSRLNIAVTTSVLHASVRHGVGSDIVASGDLAGEAVARDIGDPPRNSTGR